MKRNFKVAIIAIMLFLLTTSSVFCSINYERYNDCIFDTVDYTSRIELADVEKVVKDYVPSDCRDAFLYYTKYGDKFETMNLRLQILAIGQWESGWRVTVSGRNKNGTVDLGYLALNSANADSEMFMSSFGPNEDDGFDYDENNLNERYLITCIKFYKCLYSLHGEDAAYCYNAGESRYKNHKIPSSTYTYKKRISEYIEKFIQESDRYADIRIEFEHEMAKLVESARFDTLFSRLSETTIFFVSRSTVLIMSDNLLLISDKNKRMIDDALSAALKPNSEFVCVGYIKKYGSYLAPVFKSTITGERIIC